MMHPFNVAMTALAMCIATHAFATEGTAELQSETTLAQELNLGSDAIMGFLREKGIPFTEHQ